MKKFKQLRTTKLGDIGELLYMPEFCKAKGLKCYQPTTDGPHPIDGFMLDGKKLYGFEAKTKARRDYFPDIGMDLRDHEVYKDMINSGMVEDVCVLFIDKGSKCIWYQWMSRLDRVARIEGNCIYYNLNKLKKYRDLSSDEVDYLNGI